MHTVHTHRSLLCWLSAVPVVYVSCILRIVVVFRRPARGLCCLVFCPRLRPVLIQQPPAPLYDPLCTHLTAQTEKSLLVSSYYYYQSTPYHNPYLISYRIILINLISKVYLIRLYIGFIRL